MDAAFWIGLGWFLSVGWLVLATYLSNEAVNEATKMRIQSVMVGLWVIIGCSLIILG